MKRIKILLYLSVFVLFGCQDFLDLEPKQSIDSETALTSGENIRLALNRAYVDIRDGYGQQLFHGAELMADQGEIHFQGTYIQPREYLAKNLVASSDWPEAAWQDMYQGIYICNQVLKNIDVVDETEKEQIKGEALFLRGLCYFDLARFYAPTYIPGAPNNADAVPLVLENTEEQYPSRATVQDVYDQAQSDLEEASNLLAAEEFFFANKYAAKAILSRLYMTTGEWEKAANAANDVIESGIFSLSATPLAAFNHAANTDEDVFTFQQNNDDNLGNDNGTGNEGMSAFYASTNETGRSDFAITEVLFNLYEEGDLRAELQTGLTEDSDVSDINSLYYNGFGNDHGNANFCAKWLSFDKNMTFIRLAELYLTRAEANLENNSEIGAAPVEDITKIRLRAGVDTPDTVDLEFVRNERIRELIFEGNRLHDYKRWGWSVEDLAYDSPKLVFPVPQRERDVNKNLSQNESY
ncbi:MAG: RagB/SusD family nutrient uptake outer membrane protein [Prolixibacteraceae bacterium]|nr:RagB/SusD family nutrient uptake outer membrane protein [Prolixibacteraceae bacterium]